ncbi:hypothetical protein PMIN07_008506 [Paraphaeosphaeria minitans]
MALGVAHTPGARQEQSSPGAAISGNTTRGTPSHSFAIMKDVLKLPVAASPARRIWRDMKQNTTRAFCAIGMAAIEYSAESTTCATTSSAYT